MIVLAESDYQAAIRAKKSLVELFAPLRGIDLDVAPRDEDDREAPSF